MLRDSSCTTELMKPSKVVVSLLVHVIFVFISITHLTVEVNVQLYVQLLRVKTEW